MPPEERRSGRLLTLLIFLVAPLALVLAINVQVDLVSPIWFDEMIVSRTALQPDLSALWKILASGQSPHPPLNFLAVRAVYWAFGVSELTTRLPSTLGFTAMLVCLFFFVEKRSNAAFGAVAMLFPVLGMARLYAVEAKPYGALLGWTGVAMICWRFAKAGQRYRGWALTGLGIALASATSSQFFGALLGVPILAGEAVRLWERRRVDWLLAAVITLNYWPLVFFIPILKAGGAVHGAHPWQQPLNLGFLPRSFDLLLAGTATPVVLCVLIAAAFRIWRPAPDSGKDRMPADELAAATALALLPAFAFCCLRLVGIKVIEEKYLITMVVGISILFAWSIYALAGRSLFVGSVLAAILCFWGCRDFVRDLRTAQEERFEDVNFSPPSVTNSLGPIPILVDSILFTTLEQYAAPAIGERVYYAIDPEGRLKYGNPDALDRSILLNPGFFGRHVEPVKTFEAAHHEFLIYERFPHRASWRLQKYKDDGASIELLNGDPFHRWYLVTR